MFVSYRSLKVKSSNNLKNPRIQKKFVQLKLSHLTEWWVHHLLGSISGKIITFMSLVQYPLRVWFISSSLFPLVWKMYFLYTLSVQCSCFVSKGCDLEIFCKWYCEGDLKHKKLKVMSITWVILVKHLFFTKVI